MRSDRVRITRRRPRAPAVCGRSAVGSASPCQGEGRGFESRRPLDRGQVTAGWPSGLGKGLQSPVRGFDSRTRLGRLAQWESASLTRKRSLVQSQYRPPPRTAPDQQVQGPFVSRGPASGRRARADLEAVDGLRTFVPLCPTSLAIFFTCIPGQTPATRSCGAARAASGHQAQDPDRLQPDGIRAARWRHPVRSQPGTVAALGVARLPSYDDRRDRYRHRSCGP